MRDSPAEAYRKALDRAQSDLAMAIDHADSQSESPEFCLASAQIQATLAVAAAIRGVDLTMIAAALSRRELLAQGAPAGTHQGARA